MTRLSVVSAILGGMECLSGDVSSRAQGLSDAEYEDSRARRKEIFAGLRGMLEAAVWLSLPAFFTGARLEELAVDSWSRYIRVRRIRTKRF